MFTERSRKQYPAHEELDDEQPPQNSSLALMSALIGEGKRVLDVGCATGYFARSLAASGCTVTGIDVNAEAAEAARDVCAEVFIADLDTMPLGRVLGERRFDVVVMGDVLEHLRNPAVLLEAVSEHLEPDGFVVASIPNIAHGAIRLSLLAGRFQYQELGLLDDTHLRFFTRKTVDELFLLCGYAIDEIRTTTLELFEPSDLVPSVRREDAPANVLAEIQSDPDHRTLQFVLRATPLSPEARLRAIARRFVTVNDALADAQAQARSAQTQLASLERERRASAAQLERLSAESALHLAARDRADGVIEASARNIERLQGRVDELEQRLELREAACREQASELVSLRERLEQQIEAYRQLEERSIAFAREVEHRAHLESQELAREIARIHDSSVWRARGVLRRALRRA